MNKKNKIVIYVLAAFLLVIIFLYSLPTQSPQVYCMKKGGTWKQFNNGCADLCSRYTSEDGKRLLCTQMFTDGCDCGPDKCWDEAKCERNPPNL